MSFSINDPAIQVVQITRPKGKATSYRLSSTLMNRIRLRMHWYDSAELAESVGVSKSCIYAIKSGRTKWPRGTTFFELCRALDLEVHIYDAKTSQYW